MPNLGSSPIPGGSPAGTDAKGDDTFRELKAEVGKLASMDPRVDWARVVTLGTDLLSNTTKDLLVGAYLTAGLWDRKGDPGLVEGLGVLREMIDTHWDDLFPAKSRMRGRLGALEWITERVEKIMAPKPPPAESERQTLTGLQVAAEALQASAEAKLEGEQSTLPRLTRVFRDRLQSIPKPQPKPEPKPEPEPKPAPKPAPKPKPKPKPKKPRGPRKWTFLRICVYAIHWIIILNFIAEISYAGYMVFDVLRPEGGDGGPLFGRALEIPHEQMVTRRLYAIEFWIATAGLAVYLALTEIGPKLKQFRSGGK